MFIWKDKNNKKLLTYTPDSASWTTSTEEDVIEALRAAPKEVQERVLRDRLIMDSMYPLHEQSVWIRDGKAIHDGSNEIQYNKFSDGAWISIPNVAGIHVQNLLALLARHGCLPSAVSRPIASEKGYTLAEGSKWEKGVVVAGSGCDVWLENKEGSAILKLKATAEDRVTLWADPQNVAAVLIDSGFLKDEAREEIERLNHEFTEAQQVLEEKYDDKLETIEHMELEMNHLRERLSEAESMLNGGIADMRKILRASPSESTIAAVTRAMENADLHKKEYEEAALRLRAVEAELAAELPETRGALNAQPEEVVSHAARRVMTELDETKRKLAAFQSGDFTNFPLDPGFHWRHGMTEVASKAGARAWIEHLSVAIQGVGHTPSTTTINNLIALLGMHGKLPVGVPNKATQVVVGALTPGSFPTPVSVPASNTPDAHAPVILKINPKQAAVIDAAKLLVEAQKDAKWAEDDFNSREADDTTCADFLLLKARSHNRTAKVFEYNYALIQAVHELDGTARHRK
jgi:hypothetical protein